jgi:hypothetical protein
MHTWRRFTQYTLHLAREETEQEVFLFSFRRKTQDGDQRPHVADFHNTHYILPERRENRKIFCFLLGEKPKMATSAHVAQIYTIHITFCRRGDRTGRFSVFF